MSQCASPLSISQVIVVENPPAPAPAPEAARPQPPSGNASLDLAPAERAELDENRTDPLEDAERGEAAAPLLVRVSNVDTPEFFEAAEFILSLTGALQRYGVPTDRVETQIADCAASIGIKATVAVFPTYVTVMLGTKTSRKTYTYNVANEFSWDLDKQELANNLSMRVSEGRIPIARALAELKGIKSKPGVYKEWMTFVALIVMSPAVCPMFYKGGMWETICSIICGFLTGVVVIAGNHSPNFARVADCVNAILVAFFVFAANRRNWFGQLNTMSVILAGIVWALPGLQLIKSTGDLGVHMAVAGSARLLYALLVIFELSFGVSIGFKMASWIPLVPVEQPASLPTAPFNVWLTLVWLPVSVTTFSVLLNANLKQFTPIMVSSIVAVLVSLLTDAIGSDATTVIGMTVVVILCNSYARVYKKSAAVPITVSSLLLVSSSLGVRGVTRGIVDDDVSAAFHFIYSMIMTTVCITVGSYVANAALA